MQLTFPLHTKHLVLGFGPTGLSIVNALHYLGAQHISAMDTRLAPPNLSEIKPLCNAIHVGGFDMALLDECDYLWISPGVPLASKDIQTTLARLPIDHVGGDIELFARIINPKDTVFAITGTNGKSTVTTLLGDIFKAQGLMTYVGGNLGDPALNMWLDAEKNHSSQARVFVLELSSFQLETTDSLDIKVGAILNIEPDHLDRYRNFEHYRDTKFKLFAQSQKWVSNYDDSILHNYAVATLSHHSNIQFSNPIKIEFSLQHDQNSCEWWVNTREMPHAIYHQSTPFISLELIPMGGLHNIANVMAACAMATAAEVSPEAIRTAVVNFKPLPHRCTLIKTINGVRYFNDSKATNLPSTIAAILGFHEPKWLILGGITKDQDFSVLADILKNNIVKVLLIGSDVSQILPHIPCNIAHEYVVTLAAALTQIHQHAVAGDVVLFSPACASFDQFTSYDARGNYFINLVEQL